MHILSRPDIHIVKVCSFKPYFDLILLCSSIFEGKEEQIVLLHGRLMYHSMSDVIFGEFLHERSDWMVDQMQIWRYTLE